MRKRIVAIAFLISLLNYGCFAQQDSLYTDTVIVVKDPHVIKKEVYAYDTPSHTPSSLPWMAEVFFIFGKPNSSFPLTGSLQNEQSWNAGLLVTRQIKKWEFGLGFSILSNALKYDLTPERIGIETKDSSYTKVLDSYIQRVGGKDTTIYITEERDTSMTRNYTILERTQGNHSYQYLQIPLSVGYRIDLWRNKLFILPRLQAIFSTRIGQQIQDFDPPRQRMSTMGAQLNLGYAFSERFSVLAKAQWQTTLSKFLSERMLPNNWTCVSYGIGFALRF